MNTASVNTTIIEGYLELLDNLSPSNKLDLIARLSVSVKADLAEKQSSFQRAFGGFETDKNADEIIEEIRNSRTFTRQIDEL